VIADAEKRERYDRYGHAGVEGMNGGGFGQSADLGDLLGGCSATCSARAAAGGRRRAGPQPGRDIQVVLDLELVEAATGVKKSVTIQREDHCGTCHGSGAKPGTQPAACKRCGGQGVVIQRQGFFQVQQTCRACGGAGVVIADPCPTCKGNARVVARKTVEVDVPAGIDTGDRMRYPGQGDAGAAGAPRGDLEFVLRVKEHKFFQRDGQNLVCQWPVTFAQAALGGPLEITTLTGEKVRYDLPRATQTHEVLKLAGHGLPGRRGGRKGDLLVQVVVDTPQHLTAEQEQLYRRLAELDAQHAQNPPHRKSVFARLKDWLTEPQT
jgi:molecular chaperone DnaJ